MSKKYICYGGWITARDGDRHHITPTDLARLYKVNPAECIFIDVEEDSAVELRGYTPKFIEDLVALGPRNDGDYRL